MKLLITCFVVLFAMPANVNAGLELEFGDLCDEEVLGKLELNGKNPIDISTINYKEYIDYSVTFEESKDIGFSKYFCSPKLFAKSTVVFLENDDELSTLFNKLDKENKDTCKGTYKKMSAIEYYTKRKESTFLSKYGLDSFNEIPEDLASKVSSFKKYITDYKEFVLSDFNDQQMSICMTNKSEYRIITNPKSEATISMLRLIFTDNDNFPEKGVEIFW